ncbi:MAG: hypothetical protein R6V53_03905 [Candidatus Woesearchaeota archaeon]
MLVRENIHKLMEDYFGASADFLLQKVLDKLEIKDLHELPPQRQDELADTLVHEIFSAVASPQKQQMLKEKIKLLLEEE